MSSCSRMGARRSAPQRSARYATKGQIVAERMLRAAAVERGAAAFTAEAADAVIARFAESGRALGGIRLRRCGGC